MLVIGMEDSLCERLWALLEGEVCGDKFGAAVVGNQIQPPWDGMTLILTICGVGEHEYVCLRLRYPCVAEAQLDSTLQQLAACSKHATGPMGVGLLYRDTVPKNCRIAVFCCLRAQQANPT